MGIEPTLFAWEAKVLPLNYTRVCKLLNQLSGFELGITFGVPLQGRFHRRPD
jgi:hypothetical protein